MSSYGAGDSRAGLQISYECLKLVSAVFHILEQVKAGTAWAQQHRIARSGHLVAGPGLDSWVLPVAVVDLKLDELHLGVRLQNLLQLLRRGLEGEPHVPDEPLLFLAPR